MNFGVFKVKISIRIEVLIEHFWISVSMSLPFLQIYKSVPLKVHFLQKNVPRKEHFVV